MHVVVDSESLERMAEELERSIGSRYLDWRVAEVLGLPVVYSKQRPRVMSDQFPHSVHVPGGVCQVPFYTTSLSAARNVSNWVTLHASDIGADGLALVELGDPTTSPTKEVRGIHQTLEIAWCAAALRARAEDLKGG